MKWIKTSLESNCHQIFLSRPQVRNAFNPEMISEITSAIKNYPNQARVLLIRGEGPSFCAGADLEWMRSMVDYTFEENKKDSDLLYEMFQALRECPLPVIVVVHGAAMGGALGLMAAADIVLAQNETKFCFSEVKLGLAPAVISRFVLEKVPLGMVNPYLITGRTFGTDDAIKIGLVHANYDDDTDLKSILKDWVVSIEEAAPIAIKETKSLLGHTWNSIEVKQKDLTTTLIANRRISEEGQKGLKAFLAKSKPNWSLDNK